MGIQLLSYHHTQFVAEIIKVWHEKMIIDDELRVTKSGFVYHALLIAYRTLCLIERLPG